MKKEKPTDQQKPPKVSLKSELRRYVPAAMLGLTIVFVLADVLILFLLPSRTKNIVTTRSRILAYQLQEQSAQKLIADLNATKAEQEKIYRALPNQTTLLDVIQFLESLKEVAQIKNFAFVSESPVKDDKGYHFLPLTLTLEGTLQQTMIAITRLQQSPYLFTVDQTRIESPSGATEVVTVQVALRLYVSEPFAKN